MLDRAIKNIQDIVILAIGHRPPHKALLVYDEQSSFSKFMTTAYRHVLPEAAALSFDRLSRDEILKSFNRLSAGDLVILIQSASFRLNEYRIRVELFKQGLKVIEHPHLARMHSEDFEIYVDALAYDPAYYRIVGPALKTRIDHCHEIKIFSGTRQLVYDSPFEEAKLNIGDYSKMKNTGGQFPIGEVFSEPKKVHRVNGMIQLFAFGDRDFSVHGSDEPFWATVENGLLVDAPDAPEAFQAVLEEIRESEQKIWLRELGFGLNRAMNRYRRVHDISAYERMCGIHLSLGGKHSIYTKPGFPKSNRFHVDVFAAADRVEIDGIAVFENNHYLI